MKLRTLACLLGAFSMSAAAVAQRYSGYHLIDLGTFGGTTAQLSGLNDSFQAIGYAWDSAQTPHQFFYSNGVMTQLNGPSGDSGYTSTGINNLGNIVGTAGLANGTQHIFVYSGGSYVDLLPTNTDSLTPYGIDDAGNVAATVPRLNADTGCIISPSGQVTYLPPLKTNGGMYLSTIGSGGQVVGFADDSTAFEHAFLYSGGTSMDLGSLGTLSVASAVNTLGQAAGYCQISVNGTATNEACIFDHGAIQNLNIDAFFGGNSPSYATGINTYGQVVGIHAVGNFLYDNGGLYDIKNLIDNLPATYSIESNTPPFITDKGYISTAVREEINNSGPYPRATILLPYLVDAPTSVSIVHGAVTSGDLTSLFATDQNYLVIQASATSTLSQPPVSVIVSTTSSFHTPTDVRVKVTGKANTINLNEKVELYDYVAGTWVTASSTAATQSESTITAVGSNPARFVDPATNNLMARISWIRAGATSVLRWGVSVDQVEFDTSP